MGAGGGCSYYLVEQEKMYEAKLKTQLVELKA
jgi:hypothetical protein